MTSFKNNFKKLLLISSLLGCCFCSLSAQFKLDVEGDTKFLGKIEIINATNDSSVFIGANAGINILDNGKIKNNTFIGTNAGQSTTTGLNNVFLGHDAGKGNLTGSNNIFLGNGAGIANTTGSGSTFVGIGAGNMNTGGNNTFIGSFAGENNSTGKNNTLVGHVSGNRLETGERNTMIGFSAGSNITTGSENVYIGEDAGRIMFGSNKNTMIGANTGPNAANIDSLERAIAIGYNAKVDCHNCAVIGGTGPDSVKVGIGTALPTYTLDVEFADGSPNISPGNGLKLQNLGSNNHNWQFYVNNTTGDLEFYNNEVFKGAFDNTTGQYTSGSSTIASQLIGILDLQFTNADPSVYIGANIGNHLTSVGAFKRNTFIGNSAGQASTNGTNNTFIGDSAGQASTSGIQNTFLGSRSGFNTTTGEKNTLIGYQAGNNISTGNENVYIGEEAGQSLVTSTKNTMIGTNAGPNPISGIDSLDKAIAIGYNARVNCHNCAAIGGTGIDAVKVGIGTTTPIYTLDVQHINGAPTSTPGNGLNIKNLGGNNNEWQLYVGDVSGKLRLYKNNVLRGTFDEVSGNYTPNSDARLKNNVASLTNQLPLIQRLRPTTYHFNGRSTERKVYGLIAQEVQKVLPDIVLENEADNPAMKTLGISYTELIPVLIAGMQEQQALIQQQNKDNQAQAEQLADLTAKFDKQEATIKQLQELVHQLANKPSKATSLPHLHQYELPLKKQASLSQNQPNPFYQNTTIHYFIPENAANAYLQVTSLSGMTIGKTPLLAPGNGQITIQTNDYPVGTYYYSLVVDGQVVETKKMVLVK